MMIKETKRLRLSPENRERRGEQEDPRMTMDSIDGHCGLLWYLYLAALAATRNFVDESSIWCHEIDDSSCGLGFGFGSLHRHTCPRDFDPLRSRTAPTSLFLLHMKVSLVRSSNSRLLQVPRAYKSCISCGADLSSLTSCR